MDNHVPVFTDYDMQVSDIAHLDCTVLGGTMCDYGGDDGMELKRVCAPFARFTLI